jgi:hypothetical protein
MQAVRWAVDKLRYLVAEIGSLLDAIRYAAAGAPLCSGEDCTPESHAVLSDTERAGP